MKRALLLVPIALFASVSAPWAGPQPQEPAPRARFHWADANGDGLQDAFVVRPGGVGRLLLADGDGGFVDRTDLFAGAELGRVREVAWGDLEGDQRLELLVVGRDGRARLFAPSASGTEGGYVELTDLAGLPRCTDAVAAEWLDFDEDGKADILVHRRGAERLYRGDGRGLFDAVPLGLPEPEPVTSGAPSLGVAVTPTSIDVADPAAAPPRSAERTGGRTPVVVPDSASTDAGTGGTAPGHGAVTSIGSLGSLDVPRLGPDLRQVAAMPAIRDQANGGVLFASSEPTEGLLFPLGEDLFVEPGSRHVGVGTTNPETALHVVGGSDVAPSGGGFLQLGSSSGANVAIDDNELMARDGGAVAPLYLNSNGGDLLVGNASTSSRLGIGTASPEARLHVFDGSAGSVTANSNSTAVFERSASSFLSILAPNGLSKGLLFGNPDSNASGGLIYDQASVGAESMQFRTGGNLTRMTITSAGNVGIGTTNPSGKLHVSGSSGDGTVVLPSSSVGPAELFGEMGIANDIGPTANVVNATVENLAGRTITTPSSGYVLAIATTYAQNLNPLLGEDLALSLLWSQTGKETPAMNTTLVAGIGHRQTISLHGVFAVDAGSHTFYLRAHTEGLDIHTYYSRLCLLFVPTSYGTTDVED